MPLKKLTNRELKLSEKPWITKNILDSMKARDKILKNQINAKDQTLKADLENQYKTIRNQITNQIKQSKIDQVAVEPSVTQKVKNFL